MSEAHIGVSLEQVADFCGRWQIRECSLFGSVLRDDFRPDSDVDVLVSFSEDARHGLWELAAMAEELERLFGRHVDLVEREGLRNPFRLRSILSHREVLYVA